MNSDKVILAVMPMGAVQVPNLGVSLLKSALVCAGIPCDLRYFSVEFLDRFVQGDNRFREYIRLIEDPRLAYTAASYFSAQKYPHDPVRDNIVRDILSTATPQQRAFVTQIGASAEAFLDYCLEAVDWREVRILGLTSLFAGMTPPAMALAGRVKARFPHLTTILGGWNTSGEMGEVLLERFDEFDYVLRGEADETFPVLVERIFTGKPVDGIPGLVARTSTGIRAYPQSIVRNLDTLPIPDFDDFFSTIRQTGLDPEQAKGPCLPFESSRGCWWGEVKHCRFCGLNGLSMPYRSKHPERIVSELDHLTERYKPSLLIAADTILDNHYFQTTLPLISGRYPGLQIAYEVKAPIRREQARALKEAGIRDVTVGIESLSSRILKLMDKGTTFLQNVHCLRLAREFDIKVGWQYLYGFPSETPEDYEAVFEQISLLTHLTPPQQACRMTLARFSPYFDQAKASGIGNIRPHSEYRACYNWSEADLMRVAYHFEFDFEESRASHQDRNIEQRLHGAVDGWNRIHANARLDCYVGASTTAIVDTRFAEPCVYLLDGAVKKIYQRMSQEADEAALLAILESGSAEPSILADILAIMNDDDAAVLSFAVQEAQRLQTRWIRLGSCAEEPGSNRNDARSELQDVLAQLRAAGLIVSENGRCLGLAVPRGIPQPAQEPVIRREALPQLAL